MDGWHDCLYQRTFLFRLQPVKDYSRWPSFSCLLASEGIDFRHWLREDVFDSVLQNALKEFCSMRPDRFSEQRGLEQPANHHAEMADLGG